MTVNVEKKDEAIYCVIDDDGVGREMSKQNKFKGEPSSHQSKGVHLTHVRLDLHNLLNEVRGSIETIDKKNSNGKSEGTTVIIKFKED